MFREKKKVGSRIISKSWATKLWRILFVYYLSWLVECNANHFIDSGDGGGLPFNNIANVAFFDWTFMDDTVTNSCTDFFSLIEIKLQLFFNYTRLLFCYSFFVIIALFCSNSSFVFPVWHPRLRCNHFITILIKCFVFVVFICVLFTHSQKKKTRTITFWALHAFALKNACTN